jgi:hypothetical protein
VLHGRGAAYPRLSTDKKSLSSPIVGERKRRSVKRRYDSFLDSSTQNEHLSGPNMASKAPLKEKLYSDLMRYTSLSGIAHRNSESP